jgi:putative ABC transport system ATP-binding protein
MVLGNMSLYKPDDIARTRENGCSNNEPLIRLKGVVKVYHSISGDFKALKGIDLDVYPGEFVGVIGRSGAGKTTLVNIITGIDRPTEGEVWVNEVAIQQLDENQLALWRGKNLGVIYQSFQLMPTITLLDNIVLPMDLCGQFHPRKSLERAMTLLSQVGLEEHAYKLPRAISGGQQQRVAIARALANDPPVIIADEPTGRLDSVTAETIFNIFDQLVKDGKTILMVTHDQSLASRLSRVIQIADGKIIADNNSNSKVPDLLKKELAHG